MRKTKHVLGLSGGRDSAALAVYMRDNHPELDIEYFFTDTGKELPEVYEYLIKLEGYLGKPILRLNSDKNFDYWLMQHNNFLPSIRSRWCTVSMKLLPFEQWINPFLDKDYDVFSYVAIRADESYREGYRSDKENLIVKLPFREDGVNKKGVMDILNYSGLGLPEYYQWRSRSCTFCFFQRKIEWVGLLEKHPEAFEEAKSYEKNAVDHGSPFTWCDRESLEELSRPERVQAIKDEYAKRLEHAKKRKLKNPLREDEAVDIDEIYGQSKVCLACHK
jgi:hypothetical protein